MPQGLIDQLLQKKANRPASATYGGVADWWKTTFGGDMPVRNIGESEFERRNQHEHSRAFDVGINPNSTQGQKFIQYLQSQGIPYSAFDKAISRNGVVIASGPHIHVGIPSPKLGTSQPAESLVDRLLKQKEGKTQVADPKSASVEVDKRVRQLNDFAKGVEDIGGGQWRFFDPVINKMRFYNSFDEMRTALQKHPIGSQYLSMIQHDDPIRMKANAMMLQQGLTPEKLAAEKKRLMAEGNPFVNSKIRTLKEAAAKGTAGLLDFAAGAGKMLQPWGRNEGVETLRATASEMRANVEQGQQAAPTSKTKQFARDIGAGAIEFAPMMAMPELGIESVLGRIGASALTMGGYTATQEAGRGGGVKDVAKAGGEGAALGTLFGVPLPGKSVLTKGLSNLVIMGGGGTVINLATGKPLSDAATQGLALMLLRSPELLRGVRVRDANGERPATVREIRGLLPAAKFDIETGTPKPTSPMTVTLPAKQSGRALRVEPKTQGELFTATRPGAEAGRTDLPGYNPSPLTIEQFASNLALDPADASTKQRYQEYLDKVKTSANRPAPQPPLFTEWVRDAQNAENAWNKRQQEHPASPDVDANVRAAIEFARTNGPSPEFRAFFGGIEPRLAGTTISKVAAFAKKLGIKWEPQEGWGTTERESPAPQTATRPSKGALGAAPEGTAETPPPATEAPKKAAAPSGRTPQPMQQMFTFAGMGGERVPIFDSRIEEPQAALTRLTSMRADPEVWSKLSPQDRASIGRSIAALKSGKTPAQILDEAALSSQYPGVLRMSEETARLNLERLREDVKTAKGKSKEAIQRQINVLEKAGAKDLPKVPKQETRPWRVTTSTPPVRFATSKVRDANGLKVVYHGTPEEFSKWDVSKLQGEGIFFTDSPSYAEEVRRRGGEDSSKGRVVKAYLDIKNPIERSELDALKEKLAKPIYSPDGKRITGYTTKWSDVRKALKEQGYDGIHGGERDVGDVWAVLDPEQIHEVKESSTANKFAGQEGAVPAANLPGVRTVLKAQQTASAIASKKGIWDFMRYTRDVADNKARIFGQTNARELTTKLRRAIGLPINESALKRATRYPTAMAEERTLATAQDALTFVVESNGNPAELQAMRQKIATSTQALPGWKKRALRAIDFAEQNYGKLAPVAQEYGKLTDAQRTQELSNGVKSYYRPGYVMHAQEIEGDLGWLEGGSGTGGSGFRHQRTYDTYADSIAAGINPKSLNAVDLLRTRLTNGQSLLNRRAWVDGLRTTIDPKTTLPVVNKVTIDPVTHVAEAPPGYSVESVGPQQVAVQKGYEGMFSALNDPSWWQSHTAGRILNRANAAGKTVSLALDTFHLGRLAFWESVIKAGGLKTFKIPLPSYSRGITLLDTPLPEIQNMIARGELKASDYPQLAQSKQRLDLLVDHGYNIGNISDALYADVLHKMPIVGEFNKWLFGQFQRGAMTEVGLLEFDRLKRARGSMADAEIARQVAKDLNTRFGNLGRQGWFKSKTAQDTMRLLFLAPQWNEGLIKSEAGAIKQAGKAVVDVARGKPFYVGPLARSVGVLAVSQFVANQMINMFFRGHPTWQNPEEGFGAKISAWIPDKLGGSGGFFLHPFGLAAETSLLLAKGYERAAGVMKEPGSKREAATEAASALTQDFNDYLRSRASIATRGAWVVASRRDYLGRNIKLENLATQAAKEAFPKPIPAPAIWDAIFGHPYPGEFQSRLLSSFGIRTERAPSGEQRIRTLAREFNQSKGVGKSGEFYESPYMQLTETKSPEAAKELLKSKTKEQILKYYEQRVDKPLTGSQDREREFLKTLNPEQRGQYFAAKGQRRQDLSEIRKLLASISK